MVKCSQCENRDCQNNWCPVAGEIANEHSSPKRCIFFSPKDGKKRSRKAKNWREFINGIDR